MGAARTTTYTTGRWPGPSTPAQRRALMKLVPLSITFGLIAALGIMPVIVTVGFLGKASAEEVLELPEDMVLPPAPKSSTLYASDGVTELATFGDQYRVELEYEDLPDVFVEALLATEDARFWEHNGIDATGVLRAAVSNYSAGGVSQGASTITMQYVRQVLAYNALTPEELDQATEDTPARKIREMAYAMAVEDAMEKEEILLNYVNTVYFGNGAYGLGAAAQLYIGKDPQELDLNEAALLAGLVQSPSEYDPINGSSEAAKNRRDHVVNRMVSAGVITRAQAQQVIDEDLSLNPQPRPAVGGGAADSSNWGFFTDYFEKWWSQQEAFGASPEERLARLNRGGYEIVSTLDADLQARAQTAIEDQLAVDSPYALGSVVVEPGTGRIEVMAVNRVYSTNTTNNGPNTSVDGELGSYPNTTNPLLTSGPGLPGYQAGSTFKLYTMIAALERDMPLSTNYNSPNQYRSQYPISGDPNCGGMWCPSNANESMAGNHDMRSGFGGSVNTYFVQLVEAVGADRAVEVAERMGISWRTAEDLGHAANAQGWGTFTLGVTSNHPLEVANSYSVLPADGVLCDPLPVDVVKTNDRDIEFESDCEQVIDAEVARAATDASRCTTGYGADSGDCGSATASYIAPMVGGPVAGKTGTSDNFSTGWFAGFTPNHAIATFIADPDSPQNNVGSSRTPLPAQASAEILKAAWESNPTGSFAPPPAALR
ncbi:transglycosylase domain-containing protein [Natronoglycomyces albus]|uniref:Penicillin-binding protein n=1 Tax=Natronoglycomyces albus TaxID=2811108 RepID=A0A895XHR4_9ACTN|nr:transglycosylase domain-containing protein [Natronoglycomyces albus]QSB04884.1 penicillin-binding protein [Natronoglycomyces albus]